MRRQQKKTAKSGGRFKSIFILTVLALFFAMGPLPGIAEAAPFDELEYFDTYNTVNDWANWQPTDANGNPNGSPGTNGWLMTRNTNTGTNGGTLTPSAGTGPTSVHSGGSTGGFLFLENSGSPPYPDRYFTRRALFDASTHELNISFAYSMYGAGMGTLQLQVHDGSVWRTEWQAEGNDGKNGSWTPVSLNLFAGNGLTGTPYYRSSVRLRFRFISGPTYQGDAAIDTVRVFGPEACKETATVSLNSIPSPITSARSIVASLGGVGGNTPEVSPNGTTWYASGWTYTPPAGSTGFQTFYARANGFCGNKIFDPFNPTTVKYDTTCADPDPSTINVTVGQVVNGSINLRSLFETTGDVGSFTYKINGAAVSSPWNSSSYGTTSPEVITLQITGVDPDCGGNTLVRSAYITVDNTCLAKAPTFGFDRPRKYADAGSFTEYVVTVYNNDVGSCANDTFTVSVASDSQGSFTSTITGTNPLVIAPGNSASTTLRVAVAGGTAEWTENLTAVRVDAASHADPANVSARTIVYRDIPLMHNSVSTGSTKHGGKWGTSQTGSKYGLFTCNTCHQRGAANIKGVRTTLPSAPDTSAGNFPGAGRSISFQDVRDGTAEFGDDSRADKSTSNRICEVCHTYDAAQTAGVNKHAYNMSSAGATTHFNKKDCTTCHSHQQGFRAGCTSCHGDEASGIFWPDSTPVNNYPERVGAHQIHVTKIGNYIASGNKDNSALTTVENRNATCVYCHPKAGGNNVDGDSHDVNTIGSSTNVADVSGDGKNTTYFKALNGANDVDGVYNPTIKRCSNIECHSNGKFTWPWYGDVIPPATVTNLAATTGTDIGTVKLTWTAPGNDNSTAGKPYRYEIRYSTAAIGTEAAWGTATVAGGPPTALWPGSSQSMVVQGLAPGTTYHFAVKTADEAGNWSALSSPNPSAAARSDSVAPVFRGLETAVPSFTTGAVNLSWPAATDHSTPLTYLIWWKTSDQLINYGSAPDAQTSGLSYQVTGLTNGTNYKFAVRARDAVGNVDTNTLQKEAIPQSPPEKSWIGTTYYARMLGGAACGSSTSFGGSILTGAMSGSYNCATDSRNRLDGISSNADVARWVSATAYPEARNITGGSFRIYVQNRSDSVDQEITIQLGYSDNTSGVNFQPFGNQAKIIKRRFRGSTTFSLTSISGQVPAGKYLTMILGKTSGGSSEIRLRYASERYRSELTVYEQLANLRPNTFTVSTPTPGVPAGAFDINWGAAGDPEGDPVRYDVFGVLSNGTRYVIAQKISQTTAAWDTIRDGVGLSVPATGVTIRVEASDGLNHKEGASFFDHRAVVSGTFTVDNRSDIIAPAAVTDLAAEHRPKAGSVYLYWSAPGDDGLLGKAVEYDIRYSTALLTESNFATATQVSGEPVPVEAGRRQGHEIVGLNPGQTYYFALKARDESLNWSGLSNVPIQKGGPACGVCHSTPPDEAGRAGMHEQHGYTQVDCAKCHGSEAVNFSNNHSDGISKLGFNNPKKGFGNTAHGAVTETATRVTYHQGGTAPGVVLYDDTTGGGGFNDKEPGGDNNDTGSCFGFNATGVTGCHGAAGSDPDGAGGPLPTYPAPQWGNIGSVSCAMCHGDPGRADATPFKRPFEDGSRDSRYAGNVKIFKAAPGIDLLGNTNSNAVGQHLVHLNFSYRFTGNSCALCHLGNEHADGTVDVVIDKSVAGASAQWNPNASGPGTPGTCSGTNEIRCHGNNSTPPVWKPRSEPSTKLVQCNECHGFTGKTYVVGNPGNSQIPHVKDGGQVRHCTWCHVEGHPREGYSISAATKASPVKITSDRHGLETGDTVVLQVKGMSQLNRRFAVVTVLDANNFTLNGIDGTSFGTFTSGYWKRSYPARTITAITKASPASVTSAAHGLANGDNILLNIQGMTQLHGYKGPVTVIDANTFTLDGVNSTAFGTFTSGSWVPDDGALLVPNYSVAGIDYSSGGIHLKRVVGGRIALNNGELIDTEAETCWGCHEDNNVSEWGTNTKPATGSSPYDYGYLHNGSGSWATGGTGRTTKSSSWVGATWDSANFSYKTAALQSMHSVNPDVLSPGNNTADEIRCSYCHDVHDLNKAIGDSTSGTPFLRGSWRGNPYKEDGAPGRFPSSATTTYYDAMEFGRVPRGTPAQQKMGGYWIDQNSGYPTSSWTLENSAGLCTMCHGIDVNNMNKFGNTADAWIGTNGHSNAVIGGSGTNRFNVYDPTLRGEGTSYTTPGMGYQDTTGGSGTRMYGLRAAEYSYIQPYSATASGSTSEPYAYEEFNWGLDRGTGSTNADLSYHRFSCSKCHNPHASRLPRLMMTNCLDVNHNSWDNNTTFLNLSAWSTWSSRGAMPHKGTDATGAAADKQISYATSAQNCHRYVELTGKAITGITKANPAVVTSSAHGLTTGARIKLTVAGMTQLHGWSGTVTVVDANTFRLDGANSTTFDTFTSGSWNRVAEQGWNRLTPWR